jgi:hypothetical protein
MSEMHAILGYLPNATAKAASRGELKAPLEVRLEQGKDAAQVRIDQKDILGVLLGASRQGETSVQILVKPDAKIETMSRGTTADFVLHPIPDTSLFRFRPPINKIFIDPQLAQRLVELQRK